MTSNNTTTQLLDVCFNNFEEIIKFNLFNKKLKIYEDIIIPFNSNKWTLTHCKYLIQKYNELYNLNDKHKNYLHYKHRKYNPIIYLVLKYVLDVLEYEDSEKKIKKIKLNYLSKNIYKYIFKLISSNSKICQGAFKLLEQSLNLYSSNNNYIKLNPVYNSNNFYFDEIGNYYIRIDLDLKKDLNINKNKNERNRIKGNANNKKKINKLLDVKNKYYWSLTNFDIQHTRIKKIRKQQEIKFYLDCSNNEGNRAFLKYYYSNPNINQFFFLDTSNTSNTTNTTNIYYSKTQINKMLIYETRNILLDNIYFDINNNLHYLKITNNY
jgi:hypothetical protein